MAVALDGSTSGSSATDTLTLTLTTTQANDLIVIGGFARSAVSVNSVTDAAGLGPWIQRFPQYTSSGLLFFSIYAGAPAALTADAISINTSGSVLTTAVVFGVSGWDQVVSAFDSGGPQFTTSATVPVIS